MGLLWRELNCMGVNAGETSFRGERRTVVRAVRTCTLPRRLSTLLSTTFTFRSRCASLSTDMRCCVVTAFFSFSNSSCSGDNQTDDFQPRAAPYIFSHSFLPRPFSAWTPTALCAPNGLQMQQEAAEWRSGEAAYLQRPQVLGEHLAGEREAAQRRLPHHHHSGAARLVLEQCALAKKVGAEELVHLRRAGPVGLLLRLACRMLHPH